MNEDFMLWLFFVILLIIWLVGVISSHTLGGFIHILLLLAFIILLMKISVASSEHSTGKLFVTVICGDGFDLTRNRRMDGRARTKNMSYV